MSKEIKAPIHANTVKVLQHYMNLYPGSPITKEKEMHIAMATEIAEAREIMEQITNTKSLDHAHDIALAHCSLHPTL